MLGERRSMESTPLVINFIRILVIFCKSFAADHLRSLYEVSSITTYYLYTSLGSCRKLYVSSGHPRSTYGLFQAFLFDSSLSVACSGREQPLDIPKGRFRSKASSNSAGAM